LDNGGGASNSGSGVRGFVPHVAGVLAALDVQFRGAWAPWLHRLVPWILAVIFIHFGKRVVGNVPVIVAVDSYSILENADGTATLHTRYPAPMSLDTSGPCPQGLLA
jgi:hypothetical protein